MTTVGSTFSRRDEGEQMRLNAGVASGMEDALSSSLGSSFKIPPSVPKPRTASPSPNAASDPSASAPHATQEEPIPGMDEWKSTYDSYLSSWQAESHEAREKAKKNRENIEKENQEKLDKELKRRQDEETEKKAASKKKGDEERLKAELEGGKVGVKGKAKGVATTSGDRDAEIKEAWELVGKGTEDASEVETDARGVMAEDESGGQAVPAGQERPHIKQTAYDPTTSTEPLPPYMQNDPKPQTFSAPSEKATQSRQNATSQAWEKVSAPSNTSTPQSSPEDLSPSHSGSGLSGEEMMSVPRAKNPVTRELTDPVPKDIATSGLSLKDYQDTGLKSPKDEKILSHTKEDQQVSPRPAPVQPSTQPQNTPPSQPPSLTLSLFTDSSRLSVSRIVAVVGINLVLPFINGIMLGFGEIFAREAVQVGRTWWRQSGTWFGSQSRDNGGWRDAVRGRGVDGVGERRDGGVESYGGARGVAGVGLSGSGGFP